MILPKDNLANNKCHRNQWLPKSGYRGTPGKNRWENGIGKKGERAIDVELESIIEDQNAFTRLYLLYHPKLCEFVNWYTGSLEVAEDLVHEVFLYIWENRSDLNPKGTILSYLYKSVKNRALNYLKHQDVERKWEDWVRETDSNLTAGPEEDLVVSELGEKISKVLDGLPEQRKKIFMLSRDYELSYREIAELLDISVKTVETQIRRALKMLTRRLHEYL